VAFGPPIAVWHFELLNLAVVFQDFAVEVVVVAAAQTPEEGLTVVL